MTSMAWWDWICCAVMTGCIEGSGNMKINTLIGLACSVAMLLAARAGRWNLGRVFGIVVFGLGTTALIQWATGVYFPRLNELLICDPLPGTMAAGLMAPQTAVAFVLIAASGCMLNEHSELRLWGAAVGAIVVTIIGAGGVAGYAMSETQLYQPMVSVTAISFPTSIALCMIGFSLVRTVIGTILRLARCGTLEMLPALTETSWTVQRRE